MKVIYSSPFVPQEWIAAHGLRPSRILPRAPAGASGPGVCPFSLAFREALRADSRAAGAILTTTCDQMRRAPDLLARESSLPLFLLNVPATWQTPAAHRMYLSELRRLGGFLIRLGGKPPEGETLGRVLRDFDGARRELLSLRGRVGARRFAEALVRFHRAGVPELESLPPPDSGARSSRGAVPLALIGGPLLEGGLGIYDFLEGLGGDIVLDGTETGERMMPLPLDRRLLRDDPLAELARIYFDGLPDVFRRPNSELYRWLRRELKARGVRGIVHRRYPWCDVWHAEASRLREWAEVPVLDVDVTGGNGKEPLLENRLQSFLEAVR